MSEDSFLKLLRDTNTYSKKFTSTDAEIIFNKVKPKTDVRINYSEFDEAV